MKLIKFDAINTRSHRSGEATIRFHKVGLISISKQGCVDLELKAGQNISIVQDEENPEDWYLLVNDENGFTLKDYKNTGGLFMQSAFIAKSIIGALELNANSVSFKLATKKADNEDGLTLYAILTPSAVYTEVE